MPAKKIKIEHVSNQRKRIHIIMKEESKNGQDQLHFCIPRIPSETSLKQAEENKQANMLMGTKPCLPLVFTAANRIINIW